MHGGYAGSMKKISEKKPIWKKPAPKGASPTKLTDAQKEEARARAEKAGRRYPNLVDNMWAAKKAKSEKELP